MRWIEALVLTSLWTVFLGACGGGSGAVDADADAGGDADADSDVEPFDCATAVDSDGDTIADQHEGDFDFDGDGTPNYLDDDSDGDGRLDADEAGDSDICTAPPDADGDGWRNDLDRDSDNDGLIDGEEVNVHGTEPSMADSDGDGYTDLAEVAAGTDPRDPAEGIPSEDFFVVLPYGGPEVEDTLRFSTDIKVADVFFLVDTTNSMSEAINDVATSLRTIIVPGIRDAIPNAWVGVGRFEDFSVGDYGDPDSHRASSVPGLPDDDTPFLLHSVMRDPITEQDQVQQAVEHLRTLGIGGDPQESHVEGLYQTATGEGLSGFVNAQVCPVRPDASGPSVGYPCFRHGALPIVVLISDAEMHNGPAGYSPYDVGTLPGAHDMDETVAALSNIGARVIGVATDFWGQSANHMRYVATATGTVDDSGEPLVYETDSAVRSDVVEGISDIAGSTPQDVSTGTEDLPDWQDYLDRGESEVDATGFIKEIRPLRAVPEDGLLGGMDATTFRGVIPGTEVEFQVVFQNDFVPPRESARIYEALIIVYGNGVARLDEHHVYIVVPPEGEQIII